MPCGKQVQAKYERDFKANKDKYEQYNQQYQLYSNALWHPQLL